MSITWKQALRNSPGPNTWFEALKLFLKGLVMGAADIIPGVSGGTIAFISGIYEKLISAIKSADAVFLKKLVCLRLKEATALLHARFLMSLGSGIAVSIILFSGLMKYLMHNHSVYTWSFFFGLILASIFVIGKKITDFQKESGIALLCGIVFGYLMVSLIPLETPNDRWFIFFSGMIAISAMILPGISGSFILLILGKYEFMINALNNPFAFENTVSILLFVSGCAAGIIIFSRFLGYLFKNHYNFTIAFLTGLIIGSLKKIWPWKEVLEYETVRGEMLVVKESNILPNMNQELFFSVFLAVIGVVLVIFLAFFDEKKSRNHDLQNQ